MKISHTILYTLLGLLSHTYAWNGENYVGIGLGLDNNIGTLSSTVSSSSPVSSRAFNSTIGFTAFHVHAFFGKKHLLNHFYMTAYDAMIGYDTLDKTLYNYTIAGTESFYATVKSGVFYAVNGYAGIERGDYSLYLIANMQSTRSVLTLAQSTTSVSNVTSKIHPGLGCGVQVALTNSMSGRMDYIYHQPISQNLTLPVTISSTNYTIATTQKVQQHTVSLSIVY